MAEELNYSKEEPAKKKYKSEKSTMYSFVRFYNRTARFVDVVWLNYEGLGVKYVTLKPKQFVDINTFVGHPWIFRDSQTGEKMVTQMKDVYEPERWTGEQQHAMPQRKLVSITIPGRFFFLRQSAAQQPRHEVPGDCLITRSISMDLMPEMVSLSVLQHQIPIKHGKFH